MISQVCRKEEGEKRDVIYGTVPVVKRKGLGVLGGCFVIHAEIGGCGLINNMPPVQMLYKYWC